MTASGPTERTLSDAEWIVRGKRLGFSSDEMGALVKRRAQSEVASSVDLTRMAEETFGSPAKARSWLERPTTALADLSPLEVASLGDRGVTLVTMLLARIDHGLAV